MLRPETASENFVKEIFGVVQIQFYFFEDILAFLLQVFGIEFRPKHKVGDNVKRDGQVLVQNFGIETDLFLGSEGVEHAADGDGAHVGHGLGDHHEAVGQNVLLNVARFGGHLIIVTQLGGNEKRKKLQY